MEKKNLEAIDSDEQSDAIAYVNNLFAEMNLSDPVIYET